MQINWMSHHWMNENIDTNKSIMILNSIKKIWEEKEVRERM